MRNLMRHSFAPPPHHQYFPLLTTPDQPRPRCQFPQQNHPANHGPAATKNSFTPLAPKQVAVTEACDGKSWCKRAETRWSSMNTHICPECHITFTPSSPRQLFCRPACAHRQRQRKYRQTHQTGAVPATGRADQSTTNSQEATMALTAVYEAALRKLRSTDQRRLAAVTRSFEGRLAEAYEPPHGPPRRPWNWSTWRRSCRAKTPSCCCGNGRQ